MKFTREPLELLLCPLFLLTACGGEATVSDPTPDASAPATRALTVDVAAHVDGAPVSCDTMYEGLGATAARARLADARLFVSDVEVRNAAGDWVPLALEDTKWQRQGVALLDFEDGTGACADSGTDETNLQLTGEVPDGSYDALRFDVGVPFALNHNDSATAGAPLDVPGMFWNWRGGYKFVRVDWAVEGGAIARWNVHLGATGCVSDAPTQGPEAPCGRPNAPRVTIEGFDEATPVRLDLAALVSQADLTANTMDTPPGCMSSPMEPNDCSPVFSALGLDFDSGLCNADCGSQAVFGM